MATISSAGIGSGLDVNSIVTQLMAIEKQPLTALQTKATTIQSTVSEYGKIKSAVSTLRDLAAKLASTTTWGQTVTNSSSTAVSATTNNSAAGSYTVEVQALASVQTIATGTAVPATTTPGAGTLHIELGTWGAGQTSFTPKAGATAVDVAVAATDTLADVRDKINAAGAGVTAMIMTDASGSRLLIRSNTSGAANAFRTSGIASLAFDPSAGATTMTQSQTAANAAATINGLAVTSASNTLSNIVDGLTLNLSALTTGPVTVNVVTDTDGAEEDDHRLRRRLQRGRQADRRPTPSTTRPPRSAASSRATAPRSACSASCARWPASRRAPRRCSRTSPTPACSCRPTAR